MNLLVDDGESLEQRRHDHLVHVLLRAHRLDVHLLRLGGAGAVCNVWKDNPSFQIFFHFIRNKDVM